MIKQIIDRTVSNEILEKAHFECVAEKDEDVRRFYEPLCKNDDSENAVKVQEKLNL